MLEITYSCATTQGRAWRSKMTAFRSGLRTATSLRPLVALAAVLTSLSYSHGSEPSDGEKAGPFGPTRRGLTDGAIIFPSSSATGRGGPSHQELETIKRKVGINLFQGTLLDEVPDSNRTSHADESQRAASSPALASTSRKPAKLRRAAYHLDFAAHQLEMAEEYEQADGLRETAALLRQQARQIRASQPDYQLATVGFRGTKTSRRAALPILLTPARAIISLQQRST